jgi:non-heme chloroperoxidase
VDLFKEAGYAPVASGWPGTADTVEETRRQPERVAGKGIEDVVQHYAGIIGGLPAKPVVIGHSFGGLIVQRLLGQDLAASGVAIDPAPIKGVLYLPPSALRVASIALRKPANRDKAVSLTAEQFRYGFGNPAGSRRWCRSPALALTDPGRGPKNFRFAPGQSASRYVVQASLVNSASNGDGRCVRK